MTAERPRAERLPRGRPTVLTIAGSDSGGGAGLQADLKTFAAHGVHGVCAVTAVTAQNTRAVTAVDAVAARTVAAQIHAVFDDFDVRAVKTGMLATAAIVEAVCEALEAHPGPPLVVDPVIAATSGRRLLDEDAVAVVRGRLLKRARVVTPNRFEAEVLAGQRIDSLDDARRAAGRIRTRGAAAALVTGGHFDTAESVDLLDDGGAVVELRGPRDDRRNHGTGCALSAAIAAGLAAGRPLPAAAAGAKRYVEGGIRHAAPLGRGPWPLEHFWRTGEMSDNKAFMPIPPYAVTTAPLDAGALARAVGARAASDAIGPGAVVTFVGVVRNQNAGRRVLRLEYEGYEPLAVRAFERIGGEAGARWPVTLAVHHRLGTLDVGDASVIIAAASPHRADAFAACRYVIERIKQIAPIWKHEFFEGGDVWIEGASADPHDEGAREAAGRLAAGASRAPAEPAG